MFTSHYHMITLSMITGPTQQFMSSLKCDLLWWLFLWLDFRFSFCLVRLIVQAGHHIVHALYSVAFQCTLCDSAPSVCAPVYISLWPNTHRHEVIIYICYTLSLFQIQLNGHWIDLELLTVICLRTFFIKYWAIIRRDVLYCLHNTFWYIFLSATVLYSVYILLYLTKISYFSFYICHLYIKVIYLLYWCTVCKGIYLKRLCRRTDVLKYISPSFSVAAPCVFIQSWTKPATAAGLDHKSLGVREVWIIVQVNRCLVLWSCNLHNGSL